jgi:hypothetical protein
MQPTTQFWGPSLSRIMGLVREQIIGRTLGATRQISRMSRVAIGRQAAHSRRGAAEVDEEPLADVRIPSKEPQ